MARESPLNPDVEKITRDFNERDLAYCDMQGNIFMAAVDRGVSMDIFAPLYMTSQLAGVMDHSFSVAGGMEEDGLSGLLQVPMLVKSPEMIVDVVIWLNNIVSQLDKGKSANQAVVEDLMKSLQSPTDEFEKCYDVAMDLYSAYNKLTDLALEPQGSLRDYSDHFAEYVSDYMDAYDKLDLLIPEE